MTSVADKLRTAIDPREFDSPEFQRDPFPLYKRLRDDLPMYHDRFHNRWVVSRYEPAERISFVRVDPRRTIRYDIYLEPSDNGSTALRWEQEITALDEAGDQHVAGVRPEDFARQIETVERMLAHYLETGEALETEYHSSR